jgi:hypothetical protein
MKATSIFFSEKIGGTKHFGLWPLSQAAEACFETREWPASRPIPQLSIEFEVKDVDSVRIAAEELVENEKEFVRIHRVRIPGALQTAAVCLVGPL